MNPNRIINVLIALFLLIYPWGTWLELNLFNIETNRGISTILIILIIVIGILNGYFTRGLRLYDKIIYPFIFIVFSVFGTLISGQLDSSFTILSFITYFSLIYIVLGLDFSMFQILHFIKILFYSTLLMVLISILDYHNLINISSLNNSSFDSFNETTGWIYDLTGPFRSRTHFANHLSLVVLLPLVYLNNEKKYFSFKSIIFYTALLIFIYASILCHSRSLVLSVFFTFVFYLIIIRNFQSLKLIVLSILIILIVINLNTSLFEVLSLRLSSFDISNDNDGLRYISFIQTLNDLLDNPIGYGFSEPYSFLLKDVKDVHSNVTYILRAGGVLGSICLLIFFNPIIKKIIKFRITKREQFIYIPVFGFLIFGISHTNITTTSFWLIIAFAFSLVLSPKTNKINQNK